MAETLTRLLPIDHEKHYPQWGRILNPLNGQLEWTPDRQPESVNFRETNGPFEQTATYEVVVFVPGFSEPFKARMNGAQIAGPDAERQANYPFSRIPELPIYYKVGEA